MEYMSAGLLRYPVRSVAFTTTSRLAPSGAWALWRQARRVCEPGAWCDRGSVRMLTAVALVLGVVLAVLGYRYG
jgi:hypothetical protein